ncbi:MAG TPA: DNA polymerase, partial [Nitrososphaera sp.]
DPDSGAGGHSLEWLLKDELGWPNYEPPSVRQFKKDGILKDDKARHDLYAYNGADTAGSIALFEVLKARAINDNVWERPYLLMLIRLSEALARVEMQGTLYDAEESCDILEKVVWPKLRAQRAAMRELCGIKLLNPNSPKQLEKLLYEDWGLTHNLMRSRIEREGKRSTDQHVREEILKVGFNCNTNVVHRETFTTFIQTLDEFKELDKQRGTYLEGLVLKRSPDGRIYTEFKIHGTESGRLSGSKPNLQNITRPKDGLPNIRSAFVPDPGCVFISADLSQAELRTIAKLSGDTQLQAIYTDTKRSLHKEVAQQFYGDNYTYEQYVVAKNINFGVAYWQSAFSFAQMYHISEEEAQNFINFWWERFPDVWDWTKKMEHMVLKKGEIQSPFGHKRRFYVIPQDQSGKIHVVKEGINFLPQNIAANITNWALCRYCEWLTDTDQWHIASPRITVHDSILVNCKISHVPVMVSKLKECLEIAPQEAIGWEFPYLAEFSVGTNWGQLEEYDASNSN